MITGWFDAPWQVIARSVSPDLLPPPGPSIRTRLRFYDLQFEAVNPTEGQLAPANGVFRETSLGFAALAQGVEGEISAYLWSDSQIYTMWGREAFGWPVRAARIDLTGPVWEAETSSGGAGAAWMTDDFGTAGLGSMQFSDEPTGLGSPGAPWLTPRRNLRRAGLDGDEREVLVVRPQTRTAGRRFQGSARASFDFPPEHPLGRLGAVDAEVELVDGIVLVVGEDVEVLR